MKKGIKVLIAVVVLLGLAVASFFIEPYKFRKFIPMKTRYSS